MSEWKDFVHNAHPYLFVTVGGLCAVAQIILAVVFYNREGSSLIATIGWITLWTAGGFGVMPIITFRRKGGVEKGDSYMRTTKLVDSGMYAVVRHPQNGVAWILINLGIMLVAQQVLVVTFGVLSMIFGYLDLFKEEERCIEKFGEKYRLYMKRVPRVNVLLGIVRVLKRR
ncbi:MAG: isoprenylcysteine carboxylmethyltransferase family protein [Theionarchaea archaeon]|nr:isoprenylcysteine carboxylmethyltransferase family protein [Theionarchaea archaeon]MBU7000244.1 isoprenylcysteine carboxylmethyltransferase family protein [Theionarchaea archaeon]MBU7022045.1 isoprenylcysteine carboxylmethyltransferase family protein [Theionarchaea archaeon]MBU7034727.1 isoprenylcysteine carboxylmethyltransferase family protein [Theionarchaea archaeon]MBU7041659.1 isoprenylcysteine carboxylmethyltransferase family protein [Theionarchaea archaeon]